MAEKKISKMIVPAYTSRYLQAPSGVVSVLYRDFNLLSCGTYTPWNITQPLKNSFESVLMRWMKLEPIIQSEVSQKDKDHFSVPTHIYGIQKDGNDNPICKIEKETQMYRTDFWTLWEKARVGCFERTASKHVYYLQ